MFREIDNLGEVTIVTGKVKVEFIRLVVDDDPRIDRVLVKVVITTTCDRVQVHQIVKVCDLSSLPSLS